jgi:hypothetical protein
MVDLPPEGLGDVAGRCFRLYLEGVTIFQRYHMTEFPLSNS